MKIVFTGGGTAGHIFPGIAIIEELKKIDPSLEIFWIGQNKQNEKDLVSQNNITFLTIPAGKLRRYFSLQNVLDIFKIFAGLVKSIYLLLKIKPNMVFSKGGFVSVPPCIAAKLLRIPVSIHESDFSPGLATNITSKFATTVFLTYQETKARFSPKIQAISHVVGTPVRAKFYTASKERGIAFLGAENNSKKVLLIIGGSLGASQINNLVLETCETLCQNFFVVHQLGKASFELAGKIHEKLSTNQELLNSYRSFEFINEEMADVLACSDIVVSRAGANSLWEIVSMQKSALLIPLSTESSRGDQIENAAFFEKLGCVSVLDPNNTSPATFLEKMLSFTEHPEELSKMVEASKKFLVEPASQKIANFIYTDLQKNNRKETSK